MASGDLRYQRAELVRRYPPRARRYWTDFGLSAAIGWAGFAMLLWAPAPVAVLGFALAVFALLRAAYFVHEIAHLGKALPGFEVAWNVVVGIPLCLPSFMTDAHFAHHRPSTFGTALDPEYEPVAHWSRLRFVASVLVVALVPPLLALRFGLFGWLSLMLRPLRRLVIGRMSSLATNAEYVRSLDGAYSLRVVALELATAAYVWISVWLVAIDWMPLRVPISLWAVMAAALALNQARTNVAHGYRNKGAQMSLEAQVADSTSAVGGSLLWELFYPVGTRFHAMHHLAPSLPYHSLRAAHDALMARGPHRAYRADLHQEPAQLIASRWRDLGGRAAAALTDRRC